MRDPLCALIRFQADFVALGGRVRARDCRNEDSRRSLLSPRASRAREISPDRVSAAAHTRVTRKIISGRLSKSRARDTRDFTDRKERRYLRQND